MDNFFKFIDTLDESVLILYDKSFYYTNHHLLISLEFSPFERPVSLKQIISSDWLDHLKNMNMNHKSEIRLITHSGLEKPFVAKVFPFQFEESDCSCFLLEPKTGSGKNFENLKQLITSLNLPVFIANEKDNTIHGNKVFKIKYLERYKNFSDLRAHFQIPENFLLSGQNLHKYFAADADDNEIHLSLSLDQKSKRYLIGIINEQKKTESTQKVELTDTSFLQSIQKLRRLNKGDEKFTNINWKEIDRELNNLIETYQIPEKPDSLPNEEEMPEIDTNKIDLNKIVFNELEILKSNDRFRNNIKLISNLNAGIVSITGGHDSGIKTIQTILDQSIEEACNNRLYEVNINTYKKENNSYLRIKANALINDNDLPNENSKINFATEKGEFESQLNKMNVKFRSNKDSAKELDFMLIFVKE